MNLFDVIKALENAQGAVTQSLDMVRSLVGSVSPVKDINEARASVAEEIGEQLERTHVAMAADIALRAKREKDAARKRKLYKRKPKAHVSTVRTRAAAASWVARRKKPNPTTTSAPFSDTVTQVLKAAGRPMESDELETEMRKLGWTTSSQNIRALFSVMMPSVKGIEKVAPRTWQWKNGNGKK